MKYFTMSKNRGIFIAMVIQTDKFYLEKVAVQLKKENTKKVD